MPKDSQPSKEKEGKRKELADAVTKAMDSERQSLGLDPIAQAVAPTSDDSGTAKAEDTEHETTSETPQTEETEEHWYRFEVKTGDDVEELDLRKAEDREKAQKLYNLGKHFNKSNQELKLREAELEAEIEERAKQRALDYQQQLSRSTTPQQTAPGTPQSAEPTEPEQGSFLGNILSKLEGGDNAQTSTHQFQSEPAYSQASGTEAVDADPNDPVSRQIQQLSSQVSELVTERRVEAAKQAVREQVKAAEDHFAYLGHPDPRSLILEPLEDGNPESVPWDAMRKAAIETNLTPLMALQTRHPKMYAAMAERAMQAKADGDNAADGNDETESPGSGNTREAAGSTIAFDETDATDGKKLTGYEKLVRSHQRGEWNVHDLYDDIADLR